MRHKACCLNYTLLKTWCMRHQRTLCVDINLPDGLIIAPYSESPCTGVMKVKFVGKSEPGPQRRSYPASATPSSGCRSRWPGKEGVCDSTAISE